MSGSPSRTTYDKVAHLLRRAGFGASRDEVDAYTAKGLDATIHELVHYEQALPPDDFERIQDRLQGDFLDYRDFGDLQLWWLNKMANTDRPLQEKMTLFWHGHFATGYAKVGDTTLLFRQNQLFRRNAVGNFKRLALSVSQDPAMILYLDNQTNRKGHANENYGRELLELFTLGIGNYTELDIHEAARAFTGWTSNRLAGTFVFARRQHDDGLKTVFGRTGYWNGDDIVDMAVSHPACARHICTKLFKFFVHDNPTPADVQPFAEVFTETGYEIKPVLEAMFGSPVFYSDRAVWQKVKSPAEFVVGAMRTTKADLPLRLGPGAMKAMGQELFNPPNVKGWDGGTTWINTTTLLTRFNFAMQLARLNEQNQPLLEEIRSRVESGNLRSPEQIVDYFTDHILNRQVSPHTRSVLLAYLQSGDELRAPGRLGPARRAAVRKIQGLMHVIMLTPEYQLV